MKRHQETIKSASRAPTRAATEPTPRENTCISNRSRPAAVASCEHAESPPPSTWRTDVSKDISKRVSSIGRMTIVHSPPAIARAIHAGRQGDRRAARRRPARRRSSLRLRDRRRARGPGPSRLRAPGHRSERGDLNTRSRCIGKFTPAAARVRGRSCVFWLMRDCAPPAAGLAYPRAER